MNKKIIVLALIILFSVIAVLAIGKINENKLSYEIEEVSEEKFFVLKENEQFGIIDKTGKTLIQATYDKVEIPNPSKDVFICYKNEKGIALNSNNQQIFGEYNSIKPIELRNSANKIPYEKSTLISEKNGKYGLINFEGKQLLDTEYDNIEGFSNIEGILQISKEGKVGIANINGTIIIKPKYDSILSDNYYSEKDNYKQSGYIVSEKNETGYKYGYIDNKGKLKLKLEYNDISRITEIDNEEGTYLITAKNGQYGVIKNKKNIINNEYQGIDYNDKNGVYVLQKNKSYGVANKAGKVIIPIENTDVQVKGENIYVQKNNIREVYDASGNKTNIDFYKTIMATPNDNYKITINTQDNVNYYGVINANNKQIIKSEYYYIEYAYGNYFIVCGLDGKLGVIDSNENIILELKYDLVQKVQGKELIQTLQTDTNITEIYSQDMKKICEIQDAKLENKPDYIKVYSDTELMYFDKNGNSISSSQLFPDNNIYANALDGKWGYIDSAKHVVVDYEYEMTSEINEFGYASIKQDGKWGCIDKSGKIIVQPQYELYENFGKVNFIGEYIMIDNGYGNVYYTKEI